MFYNIVYQLPLWNNMEPKSKNIRVLIYGTILYIVIYSLLYSKYVEDYETIDAYKHWIFYLAALDSAIIIYRMYCNQSKTKKKQLNSKQHQMNQMNQMYQLYNLMNMAQRPPIPMRRPQSSEDKKSIDIPLYESVKKESKDDLNIPIYSTN